MQPANRPQDSARSALLVTAAELQAELAIGSVKLVDASWHLPGQARDGRSEFLEQRLPGAVFFDIDTIADSSSGLPHTLASAAEFAHQVEQLGLCDDDDMVVYDSLGLFSAPRVAWNLRFMGASKVRVLDGGLPAWIQAGGKLETGNHVLPEPGHFTVRPGHCVTADRHALAQHLNEGTARVIDVRSADRFAGRVAEPRVGLRAGHMPGAINVPFVELLDQGYLASNETLAKRFTQAGIGTDDLVITSCGSGVTAAIALLALECTGHKRCALYDGSWSEWGACSDTPVVTD